MTEETQTLLEIMLAADRFCCVVHDQIRTAATSADVEELRLKLSQARNFLDELQGFHNRDELTLDTPLVRGLFRQLGIALMWASFYARGFIDRRVYRAVVMVESSFTFLLEQRA